MAVDVALALEELDLNPKDQALTDTMKWLAEAKGLQLTSVIFSGGVIQEAHRHKPAQEAESKLLSLRLSSNQLYERQLALIKIIDAGNALGRWSLCLPRQPYRYKPPRSPYVEDVRVYPRVLRELSERIANTWPTGLSDQARIGGLLVVASLRGGLQSLPMLRAMLDQLDEPRHMGVGDGLTWIDLRLRFKGQDDAERRRWFPEALCELVLGSVAWPELPVWNELRSYGWPAEELWACMSKFLLRYSRRLPAPNISQWIQMVGYYWQFHCPVVAVRVAQGRFVSHSLNAQSWARLQGGWIARQEPELEEVQETDALMPEDAAGPIPNRWMADILRACELESKPRAMAAIEALSAAWPRDGTAQHLIPLWAIHLIREGGALGQSLELSTVKKYLSLAGRRIANITGSECLLDLDTEGWGALYESVLELARSIGHRKYLAKTLNAWHRFLVSEMGVPDIDAAEVLGLGGTRTPVDASLITLDEFLEIRHRLMRDVALASRSSHAADVAWIVLTLGFRCGLRRSEVLGLRVRDVHLLGRAELLVRPHSMRRLKSRSGTRKLPLAALLDDEELGALGRLVERRQQEEGLEALLMDIHSPGSALGQSFLIPHIHAVMRAVVGDDTVRFHHLRHSFASWNLLKLLAADRPIDLSKYLPRAPLTAAWVSSGPMTFRQQLLGISQGTTRKSAYAVSRLLGHSEVRVTLEHYAHVFDWVWAESSASLSPQPSTGVATQLLPYARSTVYRYEAHRDLQGALSLLRARQRKEGSLVCPFTEGRPPDSAGFEDLTARVSYGEIYKHWWAFIARAARAVEPGEFDLICKAHELTPGEGHRLLKVATNLASLERRAKFRHPVLEVGGRRCMVPPWPYRQRDQQLFSGWADALGALIGQPENESEGLDVGAVLSYWARHAWGTRVWMPFSPKKYGYAKGYVRLVSLLVGADGFEVLYCDTVTQRVQRRVNKLLGLPQRRPVLETSPTNSDSDAARRTVIVRPVHKGEQMTHDSARSWRLALYMACIHWEMATVSTPPWVGLDGQGSEAPKLSSD